MGVGFFEDFFVECIKQVILGNTVLEIHFRR